MKPISLIGPMGCGKSTLAPLLAKELQCEYFDTDDIISKNENMYALEVFRKKGESYFREQEFHILKNIFEENRNSFFIVATGGGTPVLEKNRGLLFSHTKSIFLKTSLEEIEKRLFLEDRPSWCWSWLKKVYPERIKFYEMSDLTIETDFKEPSQIVKEIVSVLSS